MDEPRAAVNVVLVKSVACSGILEECLSKKLYFIFYFLLYFISIRHWRNTTRTCHSSWCFGGDSIRRGLLELVAAKSILSSFNRKRSKAEKKNLQMWGCCTRSICSRRLADSGNIKI
jgi:hypothetical protein